MPVFLIFNFNSCPYRFTAAFRVGTWAARRSDQPLVFVRDIAENAVWAEQRSRFPQARAAGRPSGRPDARAMQFWRHLDDGARTQLKKSRRLSTSSVEPLASLKVSR